MTAQEIEKDFDIFWPAKLTFLPNYLEGFEHRK